MKKLFKFGFILLLILFIGMVVGPSFVDWNKYKPQIITQLTKATGHKYSIEGDIELAVLPTPHLIVEKFDVKSPSTDQTIVSFDKASIYVALTPIISGKVEISRINLIEPQINLTVASDGTQSWMTDVLTEKTGKKDDSSADENSADSSALNSVILQELKIEDGRISYSDVAKGSSYVVDGIDMTIKADTIMGPFTMSGSIDYQGKTVRFETKAGRLDKIAESIPVDISLKSPELQSEIAYRGVLEKPSGSAAVTLQGEVDVKSANLGKTLSIINGDPVSSLSFPVSTKGIMTFEGDKLQYNNAILKLAGGDLSLSVSAAGLKEGKKIALKGDISGKGDIVLNEFLPKDLSTGKSAPNSKGQSKFIPQLVNLPKDVDLDVDVSLEKVSYNGNSFSDIHLPVNFSGKSGQFGFKAKLPGGNETDINGNVLFASRSVSAGSGKVTLSDPLLSLSGNLNFKDPATLASALKIQLPEKASALATAPISLSVSSLKILPNLLDLSDTQVTILNSRFNTSAKYIKSPANARDKAELTLMSEGLNLDNWVAALTPTEKAPAAQPAAPVDVKKIASSFTLPFDASAKLVLQNPRYRAESYSLVHLDAAIINGGLLIENAGIKDKQGNDVSLSGRVAKISDVTGIDLTLAAKTPDIKASLDNLKIDTKSIPAGIQAVSMSSSIKGSLDTLAFVSNVTASGAKVEAKGSVQDPLGAKTINSVEFRLRHNDYAEVAKMFVPNFTGGSMSDKSLDLYSNIQRSGKLYSFDKLKAKVGPAVITGVMSVDASKAKPYISADVAVGDLPLGTLLGVSKSKARGSSKTATTAGKSASVRWSRNAINASALHKFNMDVKAKVNKLTYDQWLLNNTNVVASVKNGTFTVSELSSQAYGGTINVNASLNAPANERQPLTLKTAGALSNVDLESVVNAFSGSRLVKASGSVSVNYDVQTVGLSPAAMVVALGGNANTSGSNIVIKGIDLAKLSQALAAPSSSFTQNFSTLRGATLNNGQTQFDTLDGQFTIKEGVVNFDKLTLTGPEAILNGYGNLSLPLWYIDMKNVIQLIEPADAPQLTMEFKGSLDDPKKTFAEQAMQRYFQSQIQGLLLNPLLEKLQEKNGTQRQGSTSQGTTDGQTQQTPDQFQGRRGQEVDPDEVIRGVIGGFLGGR